jgi:hypothetical protein
MMILPRIGSLFVVLLTLTLAACGGGKRVTVEIPPQIDLTALGTIGVVAFDVQSDVQLQDDITLKFIQHLQAAQPGVPVLELGNEAEVLRATGFGTLDTEAVKAIGRKYGVDSLLSGTLEVTHSFPDINIGQDLNSISAASYVLGNLNARLRLTNTGATIWSNGAHGKWKVASVDLTAGSLSSAGMKNVDDTYRKMVQELARVGTIDFRKSYETRTISE